MTPPPPGETPPIPPPPTTPGGARIYPAPPIPTVPPEGSATTASNPSPPPTQPEAPSLQQRLDHAKKLFAELKTYASHLLAARVDRVTFTIRQTLIYAGLGLVAGIVGLSALIYSAVLLLSGIAQGLGILCGGRPWLGSLITGLLVLGATGFLIYEVASKLAGKSRKDLHDKYEARKAQQREQFGRDVSNG